MAIDKVKIRLSKSKVAHNIQILVFIFDNLGDANYLMNFNQITEK